MDGESLPHFPNELCVVSAAITSVRGTALPSATSSAAPAVASDRMAPEVWRQCLSK
jgi:hypothetical protein